MIHTLILDLDGPILDGKFRHYQCYFDILSKYNFDPMPLDVYWAMKRQKTDRHAQLSASGAHSIYDVFLTTWLEQIEQKKYLTLDQLQPGVFAKLKEWRDAGTKMILVTMRNNQDTLYWQLDATNLTPLFDTILVTGSAHADVGKADKVRPFLDQSNRGLTLWIGDTEVDFKAARILGVAICLVSCGLRTPDYLATLEPDFLLPCLNFADLSNMGNDMILSPTARKSWV